MVGGATPPHEKVAHKAASHKVSAVSGKLVGGARLPHEKAAPTRLRATKES